MHVKPLVNGLIVALSLATSGFARECRTSPSISSLASFSEVTSSTTNFPSHSTVTTEVSVHESASSPTSSEAASATIAESTTGTTSPDGVTLTSSDLTSTTATTTQITSVPESKNSPADTTSVVDVRSTDTSSAVIIDPTSTTDMLSIADPTSAASTTAAVISLSTDTSSTTTMEATSTSEPPPIPTFYFLKVSDPSSLEGHDRALNFRAVDGTGMHMKPVSFPGHRAALVHLEDNTNRLMVADFYVYSTPGSILDAGNLASITGSRSFIACTPPFRQGLPIECRSEKTNHSVFRLRGTIDGQDVTIMMDVQGSQSTYPQVDLVPSL